MQSTIPITVTRQQRGLFFLDPLQPSTYFAPPRREEKRTTGTSERSHGFPDRSRSRSPSTRGGSHENARSAHQCSARAVQSIWEHHRPAVGSNFWPLFESVTGPLEKALLLAPSAFGEHEPPAKRAGLETELSRLSRKRGAPSTRLARLSPREGRKEEKR